MKFQPTRLALTLASATLLTLSACGGGGGTTTPDASASTIEGTAAAGLPLVGTVTVKDATGATKTVPIGTNGSYSVDVAGMTAPFVFRAEGTAGGTTYTLHSGATEADVNGNINITPLTDLVIANIAGDLASNYFSSGNFTGLTPSELASEVASLKAKLQPVLTAMGVDASIDLLRSRFTPLASALDSVLDVVRISVDPNTHIATITNLVDDTSIQDDIATKAAAETPVTLPATNLGTTADDLTAVRQALTNFANLFAGGLPTAATIEASLHGGAGSANAADAATLPFRDADQNATQVSTDFASQGGLVGLQVTDVVIHKLDYTTTSSLADQFPRAYVGFTMKDSHGVAMGRVKSMQLAKGSDGIWRLRGDGRRLEIDGHSHVVKDAVSSCHHTGLEFDISDPNPNNNGSGGIAYVMVTGPGLPGGGLRYEPPALPGDFWGLTNVADQTGNRYYIMASDCFGGVGAAGVNDATIAAIPEQAAYTLTAYLANGTIATAGTPSSPIIYKEVIPRRPLTLAETQTAAFPAITDPASLSDFLSYTGGAYSLAASNLNPATYAWVYVGFGDGNGVEVDEQDVAPSAAGTISVTGTFSAKPSANYREIRIETSDSTKLRSLMTVMRQ
jgi:hypothetical protein